MLDYLNEVLGLSARLEPWPDAHLLPLFLRDGRDYRVLTVCGTELLNIQADQAAFSLAVFQKQLEALRRYWPGEMMLSFERLTSYQRKALIEQRLQFVVPGSQLYLPRLGIVLRERMPSARKEVMRFSGASQLLFLYLLYLESPAPLSKAELSRRIDRSAMHITRAVQELSDLDLVRVEQSGRCDYVLLKGRGKSLYETARPYLITPVKKRVFVRPEGLPAGLPLSGLTALAERSMLNPPAVTCRAIDRKSYKRLRDLGGIDPVDPTWTTDQNFIELEVWKYSPLLLTRDGIVDAISLSASLAEQRDERVQRAVEEMLEAHPW